MAKNIIRRLILIIMVLNVLLFPALSSAGWIKRWQQSGRSLSNATAGEAAIANDSTTAYYNPAGVTRIKRQDAAFSLIGAIDNLKYNGRIQSDPIINQSHVAQGGGFKLLGSLLYAAPISDKWGFGFSMVSPFTSDINYGRNSFTRYIATRSRVRTFDISPSLGYKIIDNFSVGLGINAQYFEFKYEHIDTTGSSSNDSLSKTGVNDWGLGWNAGVLWQPTTTTRIGLSYRSKVVHDARSNSRLTGPLAGGNEKTTRANMRMVFPATTTISAHQKVKGDLALLGTVDYTQWNQTDNVTLNNVAGSVGAHNITLQKNLKNAWHFALGMDYELTPNFNLRSGIGYDQSPVRNSWRNLVMPDVDKYTFSIGVGYKITNNFVFNIGYSHIFGKHKSYQLFTKIW